MVDLRDVKVATERVVLKAALGDTRSASDELIFSSENQDEDDNIESCRYFVEMPQFIGTSVKTVKYEITLTEVID